MSPSSSGVDRRERVGQDEVRHLRERWLLLELRVVVLDAEDVGELGQRRPADRCRRAPGRGCRGSAGRPLRAVTSCSVQPGGMSVEPPAPGVAGAIECSAPWLIAGLAAAVGLALGGRGVRVARAAGAERPDRGGGRRAGSDGRGRKAASGQRGRAQEAAPRQRVGDQAPAGPAGGVTGAGDGWWVRMERSSRARPAAGSDLRPGSTGPLSLIVALPGRC